MSISKFIKEINNCKTRLAILVFSPLNTEVGNFKMYNTFKNFGDLVIFINDKNNCWYQNGLAETELNIIGFASYLRDRIKSSGCESIVCVGASMGAYAAILYGSLLQADYIFSFGGELVLRTPYSRSKIHIPEDQTLIYPSVVKFVKENRESHYIFFVGDSDPIDLYNSSLVSESNNVSVFTFGNVGHFISSYLNAVVPLYEIVRYFLLYKNLPKAISDIETGFFKKYDVIHAKKLYEFYVAINDRDFSKCSLIFDFLQNINFNFELYFFLSGKYQSRINNRLLAISFLKKAIGINPTCRDYYFELGIAQRISGDLVGAINSYELALKIDNKYAPAYYHQGICYNGLGDKFKAIRSLKKSLEISPDNIKCQYFLDEIQFKTSRN